VNIEQMNVERTIIKANKYAAQVTINSKLYEDFRKTHDEEGNKKPMIL
jgi:hypothetical protein